MGFYLAFGESIWGFLGPWMREVYILGVQFGDLYQDGESLRQEVGTGH